MNERNRELLDRVIENRLNEVLHPNAGSDEDKNTFKEAMDALNKKIELEKIETSHQEQIKKMEMEKERNHRDEIVKIEEARRDRIVQIGLFVGGAVLSPMIERWIKTGYAKMLCEFEKDYTFTTSAGRALSSLFRFKN